MLTILVTSYALTLYFSIMTVFVYFETFSCHDKNLHENQLLQIYIMFAIKNYPIDFPIGATAWKLGKLKAKLKLCKFGKLWLSYRSEFCNLGHCGSHITVICGHACKSQNITVTSWWTRWRLKSPASRLITQPFVQAQIKENIKAPRHWPLWGEFTGEFPSQRASNAESVSIWWRYHDPWSNNK